MLRGKSSRTRRFLFLPSFSFEEIVMLRRRTVVLFTALVAGFLGSRLVFSQDSGNAASDKPADTTTTTTGETTVVVASVPDYFDGHATDTNGDGKIDKDDPPKWPDATGGAAGVPAAPAAKPSDDDPSKLTIPDVYHRVIHNAFSINMVWVLIA